MSDQELVRFTPKLLAPQQLAALVELVCSWHNVSVDIVGAGQLGVLGPDQTPAVVLRHAHQERAS
jgi:hypothetical protein